VTCERVQRLFGIQRELDRGEQRYVALHLRHCETCRDAWQDEQRVLALVRGVPQLEPERSLEGRLLAIPTHSAPRAGPAWPLPHLAVALAVLVLGAAALSLPGGFTARDTDVARPPAGANPDSAAPTSERVTDGAILRQGPPGPALDSARAAALSASQAKRSRPVTARAQRAAAPPDRLAVAAAVSTEVPATSAGIGPAKVGDSHHHASRQGTGNDPGAAGPGGSPTMAPPEPTDTSQDLTVVVFADLAGGGTADCPGCDGHWGDDDAAAAENGHVLLGALTIGIYDATGTVLKEDPITPDSARVERHYSPTGRPPFTVQLQLSTSGWSICRAGGASERQKVAAGPPATVNFPLSNGCPRPTSVPTATATASAAPVEQPTSSPTPAAPTAIPPPVPFVAVPTAETPTP
jgi:hypothetical protein